MIAILCSLHANIHSDRRFTPADFMPSWDGPREREKQSPESMIAAFESVLGRDS